MGEMKEYLFFLHLNLDLFTSSFTYSLGLNLAVIPAVAHKQRFW